MTGQDSGSLSALNELVMPEPVPFWPPAPGWYAVGALLLLALAWATARAWRRHRANAYRREAARELEGFVARGEHARLPELLKRTALAAYPRERVAALSGEAWLAFLSETGGRHARFDDETGDVLLRLSYEPAAHDTVDGPHLGSLVERCRRWIRVHTVPAEAS